MSLQQLAEVPQGRRALWEQLKSSNILKDLVSDLPPTEHEVLHLRPNLFPLHYSAMALPRADFKLHFFTQNTHKGDQN